MDDPTLATEVTEGEVEYSAEDLEKIQKFEDSQN